MKLKIKHEYWIPDDDNIKNKIIKGFQQLYKDDKIIEDKSIQISEIMLQWLKLYKQKSKFSQLDLCPYQKVKLKA